MMGRTLEAILNELAACRAKVATQGEKVRSMKKGTYTYAAPDPQAQKNELNAAVKSLLELKERVTQLEVQVQNQKPLYTRCRQQLENLARRRSFFFPSFEIYGGVAGFYDWGPPGCALKAELEAYWRRFFVLNEDMLEISATCLTPHAVLQTSGHVERFCDLMTADALTGECYRADKLLEDVIEKKLADQTQTPLTPQDIEEFEKIYRQAGSLSAAEIHALFEKFQVKSPVGNNPLTYPFPFNLMFRTQIGPKGRADEGTPDQRESNGAAGSTTDNINPERPKPAAATPSNAHTSVGFLRPETAQGIFVNFRRLLEYNAGRMPFAVAQLGLGFRNEIAPRNGLLRVREFQMAEIEHFVDPEDKSHSKFAEVAHLKLPLFPKDKQLSDGRILYDLTLGEAVDQKVVHNQTLAYFMARTFLFVRSCGIQLQGMRFRQHLDTEMAHYASDCWDLDIETSYGWVECVGHADRSAYDLTRHGQATKTNLVAMKRFAEPKILQVIRLIPNQKIMGQVFKRDLSRVLAWLEARKDVEKLDIEETLSKSGSYTFSIENHGESPSSALKSTDKAGPSAEPSTFTVTRPMLSFKSVEQKVSEEAYVPGVIEPSFGIGRLIYCILEHTFRSRDMDGQEERCYLALPPVIAPIKCSVLAISTNPEFEPHVQNFKNILTQQGIACKVDYSSASIGKRYARTDEVGIPFGITIDFQTLQDKTVTLRERNSMHQVRVPRDDVAPLLSILLATAEDPSYWEKATAKYPAFVEQTVTGAS